MADPSIVEDTVVDFSDVDKKNCSSVVSAEDNEDDVSVVENTVLGPSDVEDNVVDFNVVDGTLVVVLAVEVDFSVVEVTRVAALGVDDIVVETLMVVGDADVVTSEVVSV